MNKKIFPSSLGKLWTIGCLAFGCSATHAPVFAAPDESEQPRQQKQASSAASRQSSEERLWHIAVDSDKAGAYDAYLRKYPNGRYAEVARARIAVIEAGPRQNTGMANESRPTATAEQDTPAAAGAPEEQGLSAEDELWKAATATGNTKDYQAYLREYPQGRYAAIARNQLALSGEPAPDPAVTPDTATPAGQAMHDATGRAPGQGAQTRTTPSAGAGKTIRAGDQTMTGNFSADPQTGLVSGTGRIVWANGNRFEGTLVRGVKQGKGEFTWHNGQRYSGDWVNDQPNGRGVLYFTNGDRYEGEVKDGQPHGQGIAKFKGGDSYAGHWVAGKRHGTGRYIWARGGYWEGEFSNGERTANGTMWHGAPRGAPQSAMGAGPAR